MPKAKKPGAVPADPNDGLRALSRGSARQGIDRPELAALEPELIPSTDEDETPAGDATVPTARGVDAADPDASGDGGEATPAELNVADEIAALRRRIEDADRRSQLQDRELELLRRGGAQVATTQRDTPPVDPVQAALNVLQVTPEQMTEVLSDPRKGAELLTQAFRGLFLLSSRTTGELLDRKVADRIASLKEEVSGEDLHRTFWRENADLERYRALVSEAALEVAEEQPRQGWNASQVVSQIRTRTIGKLKDWGLDVSGLEAAGSGGRVTSFTDAKRRMRPATAEMGGSGGGSVGPAASPIQRQLQKLAGMTRRLSN